MLPVVIVIAVVLLLAAGFYFTRDAPGPPPLGAEDRLLDDTSRRLTLHDDSGREL